MPKFPDRWLNYSKYGEQIPGSRIICFKTPLKDNYFQGDNIDQSWTTKDVMRAIPNLGLIIDLTFSTKYYDSWDFESNGIEYLKILCEGHRIPNYSIINKFCQAIIRYSQEGTLAVAGVARTAPSRAGVPTPALPDAEVDMDEASSWTEVKRRRPFRPHRSSNAPTVHENRKLIGVHCTHGLNRTGYLVCLYLMECLDFKPDIAISLFEKSRGHQIERSNYTDDLYVKYLNH